MCVHKWLVNARSRANYTKRNPYDSERASEVSVWPLTTDSRQRSDEAADDVVISAQNVYIPTDR